MTKQPTPYGTALIKGSDIINAVAEAPEPLTTTEISQITGITLSTTSKLLDTLQLIGYVRRTTDKKRFAPGFQLINLTNSAFLKSGMVHDSYQYLNSLREQTNQLVHLGLLNDDMELMYLNKLGDLDHLQKSKLKIGITHPLYCSAMGKAFLANMSDKAIIQYLKQTPLIPYTEATIIDQNKLWKEIETIRTTKIAYDRFEISDNIFCVGTTISLKNTGHQYGFSVTMLREDVNEDTINFISEEVIKTKNVIDFHMNHSDTRYW